VLHYLVAMEFVLRREGKELNEVGATPVAPRRCRNRPSVDLHLKSAKQPHRAPPRHRNWTIARSGTVGERAVSKLRLDACTCMNKEAKK
jgi:hypothetical protein